MGQALEEEDASCLQSRVITNQRAQPDGSLERSHWPRSGCDRRGPDREPTLPSGKTATGATRNDWYMALAYTVRDRMMERYVATMSSIAEVTTDAKAIAYLSAEFLTGPHLGTA
jgi:hypothetical protein